jgi:hypothetical protein
MESLLLKVSFELTLRLYRRKLTKSMTSGQQMEGMIADFNCPFRQSIE